MYVSTVCCVLFNSCHVKAEKDALRKDLSAKEEIIVELERKVAQLSTSAEVTRERETWVREAKLCGVVRCGAMRCGAVRYRSSVSAAPPPCLELYSRFPR